MPVSYIGLTVSHLPTSCSFFLSALQPLGYRFIGQQGNQIGLGINDADFFLCQETPGVRAGAAHIAFSAPSRVAVRDFYTAALTAGGRPHGSPAARSEANGCFNAAVLDFDGNSIEVVYHEEPEMEQPGSVVEQSRVLTWRDNVAQSLSDEKSVVSAATYRSAAKKALIAAPAAARSIAPSVAARSTGPSLTRSVSAPVVPTPQPSISTSGDAGAKTLIGTLLGAAAGAAVAYAMCKGEEESAKAEAAAYAAAQSHAQKQIQSVLCDPQPVYESPPPPRTVHRNFSDTDSYYSTPVRHQRAIEAPPARSYHSPTYTSAAPSASPQQQEIQYAPASAAGVRSQYSARRSVSSPVAPQQHPSSRSTLIGTFVPSEVPRALLPAPERRDSVHSTHSHHSSKSKARSSHTSASKHSSRGKSHSQAGPQGPAENAAEAHPPSKPASIIGSILGRSTADHVEVVEADDAETVVPSDSISNAGSSRRARSTHSSHSRQSSHSKHSKHSKASKHSSSSRKSSHSHSRHGGGAEEVIRPDAVSEAGSASTVKPTKSGAEGGKDSVVSLPVRGITPSMIEGGGARRSVVSFAYGQ